MFKRAATELLSLNTDGVQSVFSATVHGKKEEIVKCLNLFSYFNGWSEKSVRECCILSSIKRFLPDTVILSYANKHHNYTYFIVDGMCTVIQKIIVKMKPTFQSGLQFSIHDNQNAQDAEDAEIIFANIRTFSAGECFNLGEDLTNRWVIASGAVRCLLIPRDFLLQHNENNIWPTARRRINASFPTKAQIRYFLKLQIKWNRFKSQYSHVLHRRRRFTGTKFRDVPHYCRINVNVPASLLQ